MRKYYIGLTIIGIIILVVTVFEIIQAGPMKEDQATNNTANNIAEQLDSYINNHQAIPVTLSTAGIKNVPSTITYTPNSNSPLTNTSYKFCVDYHTNSSNYSVPDFVNVVGGGAVQTDSNSSDSSTLGESDSEALFISSDWTKGENCQTITPSLLQLLDNTNP